MSQVAAPQQTLEAPRAHNRFGYGLAIAINGVLLYVVHHLLAWGWPRFLTSQFVDVLPVVSVSLVAGMAVNAAFLCYDPPWFTSLANGLTAAIAFVVAVRLWEVFPFDFSTYGHDWAGVVKLILLLVMLGTAAGFVAGIVGGLTGLLHRRR